MSNGQDAQWSRMTLRAHTNAWLHRHEDLDMASRTRSGPGEWNNPRDMENIPCVVERDAFCFCFTPALPERSDIREDDRYFPPPLHSTSLPPRYTFLPPPRDSTVASMAIWHAAPPCPTRTRPSPDGLTRRGFDYVGDKGMCGSHPPLEGMAFVPSFSTATDGASATYPNGASDSDAWARVPEIGIHPERVSRGGRGKGLAARRVRRGQRELAIGTLPLLGPGFRCLLPSGSRGPQNAARPRSATDTIGCPRLIRSFTSTRMYITEAPVVGGTASRSGRGAQGTIRPSRIAHGRRPPLGVMPRSLNGKVDPAGDHRGTGSRYTWSGMRYGGGSSG